MATQSLRVLGVDAFQHDLRSVASDLPKAARVMDRAAAEIVAKDARERAPVASGRLRASIRVTESATGAEVGSSLVYAGVQEHGWSGHGIEAHPYLAPAVAAKETETFLIYGVSLEKLLRRAFPD